MSKPKRAPKKTKNAYSMPEALPKGEVLTDLSKKQWKLGASIGTGGFGEIYAAQEATSKSSSKYPYVIKIEPHENGPLFVEMHFYLKNAKAADVEEFKKKHKLKSLGMPVYLGSGSHEHSGKKYRFLVIEKFGEDIDKLWHTNNKSFPTATVFLIALQMTPVLQYIHSTGYVHADLKGGNILLGATPDTKNHTFLVDFGLASKYSTETVFKPNPKKAHDGTIEYCSRDAHLGVPTRRGDFEILAYNLIHWLGGNLPWDQKLNDPMLVQKEKEQAMSDIPSFLKTAFGDTHPPASLKKFIEYVTNIKFNEEPNYKKITDWFKSELTSAGGSVDGPLEFKASLKRKIVPRKGKQEEATNNESDSEDEEATPKKRVATKTRANQLEKKGKKEAVRKGKTTTKKAQNGESEDEIDDNEATSKKRIIKKQTEKKTKKETAKTNITARKLRSLPKDESESDIEDGDKSGSDNEKTTLDKKTNKIQNKDTVEEKKTKSELAKNNVTTRRNIRNIPKEETESDSEEEEPVKKKRTQRQQNGVANDIRTKTTIVKQVQDPKLNGVATVSVGMLTPAMRQVLAKREEKQAPRGKRNKGKEVVQNDAMKEMAAKKSKKETVMDIDENVEGLSPGNPNDAVKEIMVKKNRKGRKFQEESNNDGPSASQEGFNDAMKEIVAKKNRKDKVAKVSNGDGPSASQEGFNDAMKEIVVKKNRREKVFNGDGPSASQEGFNDAMKEVATRRMKRGG